MTGGGRRTNVGEAGWEGVRGGGAHNQDKSDGGEIGKRASGGENAPVCRRAHASRQLQS